MIEYNLVGVDRINNNIDLLTQAIRDKLLKRSMKKTLDPIQQAAIARVSVDTGTMRGAIQQKITSRGTKGETVFGVVGIRRGIKVPIRIVSRGAHKGKLLMLVPSRYAHLIERGHKIVVSAIWEKDPKSKFGRLRKIPLHRAGEIVGFVRGKPFMRPAWDVYGKETALKTFLVELDRGVVEEVGKLNKRP